MELTALKLHKRQQTKLFAKQENNDKGYSFLDRLEEGRLKSKRKKNTSTLIKSISMNISPLLPCKISACRS